jgi:hypothetical protein
LEQNTVDFRIISRAWCDESPLWINVSSFYEGCFHGLGLPNKMSLFFSGTFIMLGIIDAYVAKIHIETKKALAVGEKP